MFWWGAYTLSYDLKKIILKLLPGCEMQLANHISYNKHTSVNLAGLEKPASCECECIYICACVCVCVYVCVCVRMHVCFLRAELCYYMNTTTLHNRLFELRIADISIYCVVGEIGIKLVQ